MEDNNHKKVVYQCSPKLPRSRVLRGSIERPQTLEYRHGARITSVVDGPQYRYCNATQVQK